ncbi:MAG: ATP-binding protein [Candidatus Peregrinibacteria bacterium]
MADRIIEITVPAYLNLAGMTRTISHDVFREAGFTEAWCSRLKLVVDELFMNAVRYGSTPEKSLIHFRFVLSEGQVEFYIEDDGTGLGKISPENLAALVDQNEKNPDLARTSGRGLATIANLWTDKVVVGKSNFGGIRIGFVKKIETTPPPPLPIVVTSSAPLSLIADAPAITIKLSGPLEPDHLRDLGQIVEQQIYQAPTRFNLILDFSDLDYINSIFIGLLASWYNLAHQKQGVVALQNTNAPVKDVLALVGLDRILLIQ